MELVIASVAFIAVLTAVIGFDEYTNWMDDYNEFGREDREYQTKKQQSSQFTEIEYRECVQNLHGSWHRTLEVPTSLPVRQEPHKR